MNLQFTQEELDFQKEVRDWIKDNYPEENTGQCQSSYKEFLKKTST